MYRQRQGKCFDGSEDRRCSRVWIGEDVSAQADDADDIYRQGRCIGREDISAGKKNFEKIFGRENIPENISPKIGSRAMGRRCIVSRVNRQR